MQKILVPTDFSALAESALKVAGNLSKRFGAEIYLLHVVELPNHLINQSASDLPESMFFLQLAHKKFMQFKDKPFLEGVNVHEVIENDSTNLGIMNAIEKHDIDLVVMGSSGAGGLKEMIVGSNTEKVVRHSKIPVLVIKNDNVINIRDIIYACDFETSGFDAYFKAVELAKLFGANLHLLFINTPGQFKNSREIEERMQIFQDKTNYPQISFNIYNHQTIERGILEYAARKNVDVIALSTHGRKGISHFLNGSITEDVSNHSLKPVLTFPRNG